MAAPVRIMMLAAWLLAGTVLDAHADKGRGRGRGGDRDDHYRAYDRYQSGDILPLSTILALALQAQPGEVLEVEIEDDYRRLVYEVKILTGRGRVMEVYLDAASGKILELEVD